MVRWNSVMIDFCDCDEMRDVDFVEVMWLCVIFRFLDELLGLGLESNF